MPRVVAPSISALLLLLLLSLRPTSTRAASVMLTAGGGGIATAALLGAPAAPSLLIVAGTVILSLEILELAALSRALTAATLLLMWATLLTDTQQMSALLSTAAYYLLRVVLPAPVVPVPPVSSSSSSSVIFDWRHPLSICVRVFTDGASFAVASATGDAFHGLRGSALAVAMLGVTYAEGVRSLLAQYVRNEPVEGMSTSMGIGMRTVMRGDWISRGLASAVSVWHASGALTTCARLVLGYGSPWHVIVGGAAVLMSVSITKRWVSWSSWPFRMRQTPLRTPRMVRRSFLYRNGSDVEVVQMQSPVKPEPEE